MRASRSSASPLLFLRFSCSAHKPPALGLQSVDLLGEQGGSQFGDEQSHGCALALE